MFCPKCGTRLSAKVSEAGGPELCCLPGDMCLSQDLQSRLELRYAPWLLVRCRRCRRFHNCDTVACTGTAREMARL
jgi:hypothetical protein